MWLKLDWLSWKRIKGTRNSTCQCPSLFCQFFLLLDASFLLSVCLAVCLPCLSVCLSACLSLFSFYLPACHSISSSSVCLLAFLSVCLAVCLPCLPVCLSACLSLFSFYMYLPACHFISSSSVSMSTDCLYPLPAFHL